MPIRDINLKSTYTVNKDVSGQTYYLNSTIKTADESNNPFLVSIYKNSVESDLN